MPGPRPASRPTPHAAGLLRRVAVSAFVAGLFGNGLGIATPGIEAQVEAQIVVSSNAGNQALVNGTPVWVDPPRPDTATIIDLNVFPPRILAEIEVPGGVTGPPQAVAITPDEAIALVASSTRNDPAKPKQGTPNDVLTVIDLQARPAKVIATFHTGGRAGGTDALSVIDLTGKYPHVVNTLSVPALPEGIAFSPDGRYLAAGSMNGSNSPPDSPYFNDYGILTIFRRSAAPVTGTGAAAGRAGTAGTAKLGTEFTKVAQARIGHWCEGIAWNRAGSTLLLQCGEEELRVFKFDGRTLTPSGTLKVTGVPSGIRTAWPKDGPKPVR